MAKTAILEAKEEFFLDRKKAENYLLGVYLKIDISKSPTKWYDYQLGPKKSVDLFCRFFGEETMKKYQLFEEGKKMLPLKKAEILSFGRLTSDRHLQVSDKLVRLLIRTPEIRWSIL